MVATGEKLERCTGRLLLEFSLVRMGPVLNGVVVFKMRMEVLAYKELSAGATEGKTRAWTMQARAIKLRT